MFKEHKILQINKANVNKFIKEPTIKDQELGVPALMVWYYDAPSGVSAMHDLLEWEKL